MNSNRRQFLGAGAALIGARTWAQETARRAERSELPGKTPHTRFAVNVEMWFRGLPFPERIRGAAELGFPGIELWNWQGKDLEGIARLTDELGLEVAQFTAWGFSPGLNETSNHDAFVRAIEEACGVARTLRTRLATVVAGNDVPGLSKQAMHNNVVAGLRRAAPIAEAAGLTLILEPMNLRVDHAGHCLAGSPDAIAICQRVDSPAVKLNWDLYHMQITEGDLCGRLRDGFEYVGYLQLADHPGRHEPGTGEIHYPRVLREAYELGYRGLVGLECSPREDERSAALRVAEADRW